MHKGDDLTTFIVPKVMKNPEALNFRISKSLFRPVAGKLYLLFMTSYTPKFIKWVDKSLQDGRFQETLFFLGSIVLTNVNAMTAMLLTSLTVSAAEIAATTI